MKKGEDDEIKEDLHDRWLLEDVVKQLKEKGKITELEEETLKTSIKDKKYDWELFKKKLEQTQVTKEREERHKNETFMLKTEKNICETHWNENYKGESYGDNRRS